MSLDEKNVQENVKRSQHCTTTVDEFKQMAKDAFSSQLYLKAIEMYIKAIDLDDTNTLYYFNRSAAYVKLKQYSSAKTDLEYVLINDPHNYTAHYRNGFVHWCLGLYDTAIISYTKAMERAEYRQISHNNIQYITQKRLSHLIPKYETLSHPTIKIFNTVNSEKNIYNPLYYKSSLNGKSHILIFGVDIPTLRISRIALHRYDIDTDTYSDIENMNDMENDFENCYKLIPSNSLYTKDNKIYIGEKEIFSNYGSYSSRKALIYSQFMNGIWCFDECFNPTDSMFLSNKLMHLDLNNDISKDKSMECVDEWPAVISKNIYAVLGCRHLLFLFFWNEKYENGSEIWCYDLYLHRKWIKSKYSFPYTFGYCNVVVDADRNYVHFMNITSSENNRFHFKIKLYQLIPRELLEFYRPKSHLLVCGYVNETKRENNLSHNISAELVQLLLYFCPIFV
eukprot:363830_1